MSIGNNVSIPKGAVIYSTKANLTIKDNVIFGPRPTIITGDHRIDVIGTPIIHSHEKRLKMIWMSRLKKMFGLALI